MEQIDQLLSRAKIPDGAHEAVELFKTQARRAVVLEDGVTYFAGHDQGVAIRFFIHQEKNEVDSKRAKYPIYNPIEMVEWLRDRQHRPTERIRALPEELLAFDDEGEVVGGKWAESYKRWKEGIEAPGLSLNKWGELDGADLATLTELGIYSVEQFASLPRSRVDRFHDSLREAFEKAVEWMQQKDVRQVADEQARRIAELEATVSRLEAQSVQAVEAPRRGRPRKDQNQEDE